MKLNVLKRPLLMATVAAALLSTGVVRAADFAGATINLIVPFRAGGGTDEWARFYASRIAEQLPGKPEIVVKNVPGAGSTTGANQFQRLARPDGLTLIATSGSTHLAAILDDPRVQYNVSNWIPIVASPSGAVSVIRTDLGLKTPADVAKSKTHLKIASQQATSLDLVALLAYDLLGWDVEALAVTAGIKGTIAYDLVSRAPDRADIVRIQHPSGFLDVEVITTGSPEATMVERAAVLRTARRIFEGSVVVNLEDICAQESMAA
jgi:tripartite-type tricarboxylate transporter receptor subunit TctC